MASVTKTLRIICQLFLGLFSELWCIYLMSRCVKRSMKHLRWNFSYDLHLVLRAHPSCCIFHTSSVDDWCYTGVLYNWLCALSRRDYELWTQGVTHGWLSWEFEVNNTSSSSCQYYSCNLAMLLVRYSDVSSWEATLGRRFQEIHQDCDYYVGIC